MILELRDYLKLKRRIALKDMQDHFHLDADALRGMLDKWVKKGQLRKLPQGTACAGGCCQCDPALTELYEWIETPAAYEKM